ncbi:hypothetical protein [Flavobacterium sp.]
MKSILSFFLAFFCSYVVAQADINSFVLSKFEKENNNWKTINELFDLNQSDTLLSLNNYKFIKLNGKSVIVYKTKKNKIVFKKEYNRMQLNMKLNFNFFLNLNPVELTVNEVDGKKIEVYDGFDYNIKVFYKNKYLEFKNYAPQTYIENEYPFFEKRKIFLDCYNKLDSLFIDDLFIKVQNAEEVYIKFEKSENMSKKVFKDKKVIEGKEIFYFNDLKFVSKGDSKKIESHQIKGIIIDYNFINQYYPSELKIVLKNNQKKIYMVENCKRNKNKVLITEVKFNIL